MFLVGTACAAEMSPNAGNTVGSTPLPYIIKISLQSIVSVVGLWLITSKWHLVVVYTVFFGCMLVSSMYVVHIVDAQVQDG